jgi:hypothetical protein
LLELISQNNIEHKVAEIRVLNQEKLQIERDVQGDSEGNGLMLFYDHARSEKKQDEEKED